MKTENKIQRYFNSRVSQLVNRGTTLYNMPETGAEMTADIIEARGLLNEAKNELKYLRAKAGLFEVFKVSNGNITLQQAANILEVEYADLEQILVDAEFIYVVRAGVYVSDFRSIDEGLFFEYTETGGRDNVGVTMQGFDAVVAAYDLSQHSYN